MKKRKVIILGGIILGALLSTTVCTEAKAPGSQFLSWDDGNGHSTEVHNTPKERSYYVWASDLVVGQKYKDWFDHPPFIETSNGNKKIGRKMVKGDFENKEYDPDAPIKTTMITKEYTTKNKDKKYRNEYSQNDKYVYTIYDMDIVLNMPYLDEMIGHLEVGESRNWKASKIDEITYEDGVSKTLKMSQEMGMSAKFGNTNAEIGISAKKEIENTITTNWNKSTKISNAFEYSGTFTAKEDGFYHYQKRANYRMYVILSWKINYEVSKSEDKHWDAFWGEWVKWIDYEYKQDDIKSHTFLGYSIYYEFYEKDFGPKIIRYKQTEHGFEFDDSSFKKIASSCSKVDVFI